MMIMVRRDSMAKKKLRCANCGTALSFDAKSCPVCYMTVERTEEEVQEVIEFKEEAENSLKKKLSIGRIAMVILIFIGIIFTIRGITEYQSIEFCTEDDCGFKALFEAGLGIILIISASIPLARNLSK